MGRHARFPISVNPWEAPGGGAGAWLWAPGEATVVPFLGVEIETPNLVLVFERPIAGPLARHGIADAPSRHEAMGGLLLAVEAPEDLAKALAGLGFPASLGRDDFEVIVRALDGDLVTAGG